jgi:hypothetical protein
MTRECEQCGTPITTALRGRRRRFCGDDCRHRAHRQRRAKAGATVPLRPAETPLVAPEATDWPAFVAAVRAEYQTTAVAERLLGLIEQTAARYEAARAALDAHGLTETTTTGRTVARPEVAIERDCRAALVALVKALDLEEGVAHAETQTARYPRPA